MPSGRRDVESLHQPGLDDQRQQQRQTDDDHGLSQDRRRLDSPVPHVRPRFLFCPGLDLSPVLGLSLVLGLLASLQLLTSMDVSARLALTCLRDAHLCPCPGVLAGMPPNKAGARRMLTRPSGQ